MSEASPEPGFRRSLGLAHAIAINLTQMCGMGPFLTIPLLVAAMGGPQAMLGWIAGAVLALADGLVWAELGAALPGAGGTYLYLREAFGASTGRLMPFLFVWTAMIVIPLVMASGVIGIVQYLGYYFPHLTWLEVHGISLGLVALAVLALYRGIESAGRLGLWLCAAMAVTVAAVIAAAYTDWSPSLAFDFPPGAWKPTPAFFMGLGSALILAVYDYAGYNTAAYLGAEVRDPGRVLPRSILASILIMMVLYLAMNIGVLGVVPWRQVAQSTSIASLVAERAWGVPAARALTFLILVTGFGSVFTGLLGGSRVPYHAARDGTFFPIFGRLHPRLHFPHVALLAMGLVTAAGTFFSLETVIDMLTAVMVVVQSLGQVLALAVLRRRRPDLPRPYRMWGYPATNLIAAGGWLYVFIGSGPKMILLSLGWLVLGLGAFLIWARAERTWPFGAADDRGRRAEPERASSS